MIPDAYKYNVYYVLYTVCVYVLTVVAVSMFVYCRFNDYYRILRWIKLTIGLIGARMKGQPANSGLSGRKRPDCAIGNTSHSGTFWPLIGFVGKRELCDPVWIRSRAHQLISTYMLSIRRRSAPSTATNTCVPQQPSQVFTIQSGVSVVNTWVYSRSKLLHSYFLDGRLPAVRQTISV